MSSIVITGANRGIGLAFAKLYCKRDEHVIALCRQSSPELESLGCDIIDGVDVSSPDIQQQLTARFEGRQVGMLINNAGILRNENFGELNFESIEEQFRVNALGPLRVTEAIVPFMAKGSKIGLITSRMGSIADNTSGGRYGYRMSKAALNIAGVSLAHDLSSKGIAVAILHPGYVQTDMVNNSGDISAEVAAQRLADRLDELNMQSSGTFWHSNGDRLPW